MKKFIFTIGTLSILLLSACNGDSSSLYTSSNSSQDFNSSSSTTSVVTSDYSSSSSSDVDSSDTSSSTSSSTSVENWTSDEVSLMQSNLRGNIIPFYDFNSYEISYIQEGNYVLITTNENEDVMNSYISYVETLGFSVSTFEETKLNLAIKDLESPDTFDLNIYIDEENGFLNIEGMCSKFESAWPSISLNNFTQNENNEILPVFQSDYYYHYKYDATSEYDISFYSIECIRQESYESTVGLYTTILNDNGYIVNNDVDKDGFLNAYSPYNNINARYKFDELNDIFIINVYKGDPVNKGWPKTEINNFLGSGDDIVPEFIGRQGYQLSVYGDYFYLYFFNEISLNTTSILYQENFIDESIWKEITNSDGLYSYKHKTSNCLVDFTFDEVSCYFFITISRNI